MKTCLVVEDSDAVRHVAIKLIGEAGCGTLQASTAAEGLDVLQAALPEIVFLDWDLPGLGALDFLKGAAEAGLEFVPDIVLCAMENDAQQFALAKAAGAQFHIIKPYDKQDITNILSVIEQYHRMNGQEELARTA